MCSVVLIINVLSIFFKGRRGAHSPPCTQCTHRTLNCCAFNTPWTPNYCACADGIGACADHTACPTTCTRVGPGRSGMGWRTGEGVGSRRGKAVAC